MVMVGADVMVTMMTNANAIEQAIFDANVSAQPEEEYDEVQQCTIAKNEAKFTLIFGENWK